MASHSPSDEPLHELKHDPVPGYPKAFAIAFAVMGLYLAIILFTTPGQVEHGHHNDHGSDHAKPATEETHHDSKESKSH